MTDREQLDTFREQAAALADRIAAAEAAGGEVPAEARLMLASLEEIVRAVEGLRTTLETPDAAAAPSPPHTEEP